MNEYIIHAFGLIWPLFAVLTCPILSLDRFECSRLVGVEVTFGNGLNIANARQTLHA